MATSFTTGSRDSVLYFFCVLFLPLFSPRTLSLLAISQGTPHERPPPGGCSAPPPLSRNAGPEQAAGPDLQQADGVLPALDADAGGRARHARDLHAARSGRVPPAARRRPPSPPHGRGRGAAAPRPAPPGLPHRRRGPP